MAGRVSNPASPATGAMRLLGVASYVVAGEYRVDPPPGTRMVRMELRGGGGAGGIHNGISGASGGGEGAIQRRMVRVRAGGFALVIGAGGSYGGAGAPPARPPGASTMLGYTALPGATGENRMWGAAAGGAGENGPDPLVGHGSFSGAPAQNIRGGGAYGRSASAAEPALFGGGGYGAYDYLEARAGGPGGDGYAFLEFYG